MRPFGIDKTVSAQAGVARVLTEQLTPRHLVVEQAPHGFLLLDALNDSFLISLEVFVLSKLFLAISYEGH